MSDSKVHIRKATTGDSEAIVELLHELGYLNTRKEIDSRIQILAKSNIDVLLVAESGNSVVGMVSFHAWPRFYDWGNIGRISSLIVTESCRRKGIAKKLIGEIELFAKSIDCARIEVTSRSNRDVAHVFYQACGYSLVKSKRFMKACLDVNIA